MSRLRSTAIAYFRCLRILDSLGYVVVALIGVGSFFSTHGAPAGELLFQTFLVAELLMGSIFLLNNRFDYVVDRAAGFEKASKNPLSQGMVGLREAEILSFTFMLLGLVALSLWIGSAVSILLYLVAWMLGLVYSAPPFRLKSRAGYDILSHGGVVIALFLMGYSFTNTVNPTALVFGIPFFMLSTVYELRNHLKDWAVDSSAGIRTTIAKFGLESGRRLLWLSIILFWVSLLAVGYLLDEGILILVIGTVTSYSFFLVVIRSRSEFVFDIHLWIMGGIYSAFKLLVLAGLLTVSILGF